MNNETKPGEFRDSDEISNVKPFPDDPRPAEIPPYAGDRVVKLLTFFGENVSPDMKIVYYPCSNVDISPSVAFPNSKVIYSDIEEVSVNTLVMEGYDARLEDATNYIPEEEIDLIFILNPTIDPSHPISIATDDGYVIANNYHMSADKINNLGGFELVGVLAGGGESEDVKYDTEDVEECFEEVDTEDDFKKAPFGWGVADYLTTESIVRRVLGKEIAVIEGYKKLREMVIEHGSQVEDLGILRIEGQNDAQFSMRLPRKKGAVDDLFVFSRVKE